MSHIPYNKRFDLFNYTSFSFYPYFNHIYSNLNDYQSCKLAPISYKRECTDEKLPSIKQLHIPEIRTYENVHCTISSQESQSSIVSKIISPSPSAHSSISNSKVDRKTTKDLIILPHKLEERGKKLRLYVSKRTYINEDQTSILNDYYKSKQYLTHEEKLKLSKQLNLPERTIQIWFQNKRQNRTKKFKFILN